VVGLEYSWPTPISRGEKIARFHRSLRVTLFAKVFEVQILELPKSWLVTDYEQIEVY